MNNTKKRGIIFAIFLPCLALLIFPSFVCAGPSLVENSTWQQNLTQVRWSSITFGDINDDGFLDLALTGDCIDDGCCQNKNNINNECSEIYINNGTTLNYNSTYSENLTGVSHGSVNFGDIDNDGDLDLVIGGSIDGTNAGPVKIYTNNGTSLIENSTWEQNLSFAQVYYGSVVFGDIDHDGLLDLIAQPRIYINNGTSLIENSTWETGVSQHSKSQTFLNDVDNDNDLDLTIVGYTGGTKVYINNGTNFVENSVWEQNLGSPDEGSSAMADVENDGDLDLIITALPGIKTEFYTNNGTTFLINQTSDLAIVYYGSYAFGDYDNDGDLDLANIGQIGGNSKKYVWNNDLSSVFIEDTVADANLTPAARGDIVWADIDNDGDLDLIYTYADESDTSKVYINNITTANTPPTPPGSFNYTYSGRQITLQWDNGSDTETPSTGLYYNLRVGTSPRGNNIISGIYGGSSNPTAGYFGNMMQRKSITLKVDRFTEATTYYWSVQSIDTALANSTWSTEQTFDASDDMTFPNITLNSPIDSYNIASYNLTFNATVFDYINLSNVSLFANWYGWHLNETNTSGINNSYYLFNQNLTAYGDGNYQWRIQACDNSSNCINSSIRQFTIDTTAPTITLNAPSDNIYNNTLTNYFSFTPTDYGLDFLNCTLYHNETGTFTWEVINTTIITNNSVNTISETFTAHDDKVLIWNIECCDSVYNCNFSTSNRTLIIDTVAPLLTDEQINTTPKYNEYVSMNVTYNDTNPDSYRFAWNITGVMTNDSIQVITSQAQNLSSSKQNTKVRGDYICWEYCANDTASNEVCSSQSCFAVNNSLPTQAIILTPSNEEILNYIDINYSADDNDSDTLTFYTYINSTLNGTSVNNLTDWITNNLIAGDSHYGITVRANDGTDYGAYSDMVNITVDTTPPSFSNNLTNTTPKINEQFYMNITLTETNPDSYRFAWNITNVMTNDSIQTTTTNVTNLSTSKQNTLTQSNYICYKYWANDTASNEAWSSASCFTVANTVPDIPTITAPTNNQILNYIDINYTGNDNDSDTLTFYIYINDTFNQSSTNNLTNWANEVGDDHYGILVSAYDRANFSTNSSIINFTLDATNPIITIIQPTDSSIITTSTINSNISYSDSTTIICNASLNSNAWKRMENDTTTNTANYTFSNIGNDNHTFNVNCTDSASNSFNKTTTFTLDTLYPQINLISPANTSIWTSSVVTFSYNVTDVAIQNCSLIINDATTKNDTSIAVNLTQIFTKPLSNTIYNWSINCTDIANRTNSSKTWQLTVNYQPSGNGGGGGGGGAGAAKPTILKTFSLDKTSISSLITQGEISNKSLTIKNTGEVNLSINIEVQGIDAIISEKSFTIAPKETKTIIINFVATKGPGIYSGKIIVKSDVGQSIIPVVIEIKEKEALFDIKIDIPEKFKTIFPGDEVTAEITLTNLGEIGKVDILLDYYITNLIGTVLASAYDTLAVETVTSFIRSLKLPVNAEPGNYSFNVNVTYNNITTSTGYNFEVKKKYPFYKEKLKEILAVVIAIIVISLVLFLRKIFVKEKKLEAKEKKLEKEIRKLKKPKKKS